MKLGDEITAMETVRTHVRTRVRPHGKAVTGWLRDKADDGTKLLMLLKDQTFCRQSDIGKVLDVYSADREFVSLSWEALDHRRQELSSRKTQALQAVIHSVAGSNHCLESALVQAFSRTTEADCLQGPLQVRKHYECCIKNEIFCIKLTQNEELCIKITQKREDLY